MLMKIEVHQRNAASRHQRRIEFPTSVNISDLDSLMSTIKISISPVQQQVIPGQTNIPHATQNDQKTQTLRSNKSPLQQIKVMSGISK